jgi:hypothetical protein
MEFLKNSNYFKMFLISPRQRSSEFGVNSIKSDCTISSLTSTPLQYNSSSLPFDVLVIVKLVPKNRIGTLTLFM